MESSNANEVARDIERGIKEGRYKDCFYLCVGDNRGYCMGGFFTHCKKSSLENSRRDADLVIVGELRCPDDCHFYESRMETELQKLEKEQEKRRDERAEKRRQRLVKIGKALVAPFQWFARLPWQTQLVLIILAILLFSPKWAPKISELIKAVK